MKSLIKFFYSKNFLSSHESIDIQLYSFNLHPRGGRGGGLGVPHHARVGPFRQSRQMSRY